MKLYLRTFLLIVDFGKRLLDEDDYFFVIFLSVSRPLGSMDGVVCLWVWLQTVKTAFLHGWRVFRSPSPTFWLCGGLLRRSRRLVNWLITNICHLILTIPINTRLYYAFYILYDLLYFKVAIKCSLKGLRLMDIYYIYLKLVKEILLLFIYSSALLRLLDKYFLMFSKKLSTAHIHRLDRVRGSYQGPSKFCDHSFINLRTLLHLHFLQHAQNYATFHVYCTLRLGITFKLLINIG